LQVWTTVDYVIQAYGWYGIAFARSELTTEFDFDQDSTDASTYVSIVGPQA
jgi:hypothetical protein